jgi:hypothetical protein
LKKTASITWTTPLLVQVLTSTTGVVIGMGGLAVTVTALPLMVAVTRCDKVRHGDGMSEVDQVYKTVGLVKDLCVAAGLQYVGKNNT